MRHKARAMLRDPFFWLGAVVAALGAVEIGLRAMQPQLEPMTFGVLNLVVGTIAAVLRFVLAQIPPDDTDDAGA